MSESGHGPARRARACPKVDMGLRVAMEHVRKWTRARASRWGISNSLNTAPSLTAPTGSTKVMCRILREIRQGCSRRAGACRKVDKGVRVAQGHVGKWTRVFAWGWGVSENGQGCSRRAGLSKSLKTAPSLIAPIRADRAEGFANALPSRLARTCEDEDEGAATFTGSTKAMCRIARRSNTQTGLRRRASDGLRVGLPLRFVTGDDVGWRSPKRIAASNLLGNSIRGVAAR